MDDRSSWAELLSRQQERHCWMQQAVSLQHMGASLEAALFYSRQAQQCGAELLAFGACTPAGLAVAEVQSQTQVGPAPCGAFKPGGLATAAQTQSVSAVDSLCPGESAADAKAAEEVASLQTRREGKQNTER